MALSAKQLREERAAVATKIRELADLANNENRDFTAEEEQTWQEINGSYDHYTRQIEIAERAESIRADQEELIEERRERDRQRPGRDDVDHRDSARDGRREEREEITEKQRSLALSGWMRANCGMELEKRQAEACALLGIRPHSDFYECVFRSDVGQLRREYRALSSVSDTAGAYTIPEGFVNSMEMAMLAFGGMREVSDILRTSSGNKLPWPTSDDTSNEGALIGENTTVSEQDVTVGQVVFDAHKYTSKMVKVPRELLEDSAFDIAGWLGPILGERIARKTNRDFTTGSGASMPKGVVTASGLGVSAASATAITADEIISLVHSVDPSYRNGARFMFHDNVLMAIRKLKDGNGQYLWAPGMSAGVQNVLYGYPVTINQHMASTIESGAKSMLFGQFGKYKIRDVAGFRLKRLVERYADSDQEAFVAFTRHDGNLLDAGTDPVKHMVH